MERIIWLADKVIDTEAHDLFHGQALMLAQHFQSPHFFI